MISSNYYILYSHGKRLSLKQPRIMGILNVTPDSFSDGGKYFDLKHALARTDQMIAQGVDIIDVGGESTGPGSSFVPLKEELRRVIPVIKIIRKKHKTVWISIDTYKAEVARQAIKAGADIVNDVTALRGDAHMAFVIAETNVPIVLMYSKDSTARTTRTKKQYRDVVKTIGEFFETRIKFAEANGIKPSQIILDPGMGAFVSADPKYSYEIIYRLSEFKKFGFPLLLGPSRKSFLLGNINDRLERGLLCSYLAIQNGASIIRTHDVVPFVQSAT